MGHFSVAVSFGDNGVELTLKSSKGYMDCKHLPSPLRNSKTRKKKKGGGTYRHDYKIKILLYFLVPMAQRDV